MSLSPTQLTLRYLRDNGWPIVEVVERWNPHARIRQDLFGFVDVLAIGPQGTLAVQTTSASNAPARVNKITSDELHPALSAAREAGWAIHVHGWQKKKNRWVLQREIDIS